MKAAVGVLNYRNGQNTINIIRTAEHFGIQRVFVIGDSILRGKPCMNAHKHIIVRRFQTEQAFIEYIRAQNYKLVLIEKTAHSTNITHTTFPDDVVLMTGHENAGFSENLLAHADMIVHIPNVGLVNCMNTSAAFAIGCYKYFEQKILQ